MYCCRTMKYYSVFLSKCRLIIWKSLYQWFAWVWPLVSVLVLAILWFNLIIIGPSGLSLERKPIIFAWHVYSWSTIHHQRMNRLRFDTALRDETILWIIHETEVKRASEFILSQSKLNCWPSDSSLEQARQNLFWSRGKNL